MLLNGGPSFFRQGNQRIGLFANKLFGDVNECGRFQLA
jgi:hypothetical protein